MQSWFLVLGLLVGGSNAGYQDPSDPDCPKHCRCHWTLPENFWSASCSSMATSPHALGVFPNLQSLRIQPNQKLNYLILYPDMFARFKSLRVLSLSHASVSRIPNDVFLGLYNIKDIDLSYNRVQHINGKVFKELPQLQSLILRGNPLIISPSDSIVSDSLKELDLGECNLKLIPSHFLANVGRLTHLSLDRNLLLTVGYNVIPNNVRYLNLAQNKIINVPTKVFHSLPFLRRLDLSKNPVNCTCDLMIMQDWFSGRGLTFEGGIMCDSPQPFRGMRLSKIEEDELCRYDMMRKRNIRKENVIAYLKNHGGKYLKKSSHVPYDFGIQADQPIAADSEVMFSNAETRALGTHMELRMERDDTHASVEGSGVGPDDDIKDLTTGVPIQEESEFSGESFEDTASENKDESRENSFEFPDAKRNEIDYAVFSFPNTESTTTNIETTKESELLEKSQGLITIENTTSSDQEEGSGLGSGDTWDVIGGSSTPTIIDEDEIIPNTTATDLEQVPDRTETSSEPSTTELDGNIGLLDSFMESSSAVSSTSDIPSSTERDASSSMLPLSPQFPSLPDTDIIETTTFSEILESVTTEEFNNSVVLENIKSAEEKSIERFSHVSTEASVALEEEARNDVAEASISNFYQSITVYLILAVIAIPIVILILMAACRKRTPSKVRLPPDAESNMGTELQDVDKLLPKNSPENGVKVMPKANGSANPSDSKDPEEMKPVLEETELEAEEVQQPQATPALQNGSTTPIQRAKARLTVLADSIPRTPVLIQKTYPK